MATNTKVSVVAQSEQDISEVVSHLRIEKGYEIGFCQLGPNTMECLHRGSPDVIVVKVHRPDPYLLEFVSVLRSDPNSSTIPIVLCCVETTSCKALLEQWEMQGIFITDFPCGPEQFTKRIEEAMSSMRRPKAL